MTLKSLQTQCNKIENEITDIKSNMSILSKKLKVLLDKKESLKFEIDKLSNDKIIISEHAILRYLERVQNIDIEKIKAFILDDKTKKDLLKLGSCTYPKKTYKLKVVNNVITTIITGN